MTSVKTDVSFQEKAFVSVATRNGGEHQFETSLNEINWAGGAKDFDQEGFVNGGQHKNYSTQEPVEFEGTLYMDGVSASGAKGVAELFENDVVTDASGAKVVGPSLSRNDLRITVTYTQDSAVSKATGPVAAGNATYRWICQNMEITSAEKNFDDNTLKVEFTAKANVFNVEGTKNFVETELESGADAGLAEVPTYDDTFDIEFGQLV